MPVNEITVMYQYFQNTKLLNKTNLSMLFYKATKPYSNVVFKKIIRISLKSIIYPNKMGFN